MTMKQELKKEIASAARDILMPSYMGILRNQDDTLATRGGGKGLAIYDDIERDPFAFAVVNKRKMAVVSFPWEVAPASKSLKDRKAAELVHKQLTAINFDKLTLDALDATLKGYSVLEAVWDFDGSEIYLSRVIPRNQRRFTFSEERELRMLTMQDMVKGEALPPRKFMVHSVGSKDGSPYGLGLGSKLFWPVFFKRQDITFWLTFADKFGSPTIIGKYPEGTTEAEQGDLLSSISNFAQESAVTVPENMIIELLEAKRSGAGDFYERLAKYMDEQISIAVLGETMTTQSHSSGLGSSQSDTHNDIRLELARADADLLTGTLQETLVKWIIELNMPGAGIPRVWRKVEQQEDLNARADRDAKIYNMGFKPSLEYIQEYYGEGWELQSGDNNASSNQPESFAENQDFPDQMALDEALNALSGEEINTAMADVVKPLLEAIADNTPDQVFDMLAAKYPEMNAAKLEEMMTRAYFVAEVWGRLNA